MSTTPTATTTPRNGKAQRGSRVPVAGGDGEALRMTTTTTRSSSLRSSKRRRRCGAAAASQIGSTRARSTTTATTATSTAASEAASAAAAVALAAAPEALDQEHSASSVAVAVAVVSSSQTHSHLPSHSHSSSRSGCCLIANLPPELVAQHVAGFCDRAAQAAAEAAGRWFRDALRNSTATAWWHFPSSGRFLVAAAAADSSNSSNNSSNRNNNNPRLRFVVLSSEETADGGRRCRRLVSYRSKRDRFNEGRLEVWDAARGCLASLPRVRFAARSKPVKPAISSRARWVACGNITYGSERNFQDGILLLRLPAPGQRSSGGEIKTQRVLEDYEVTSVQFLNGGGDGDDENENETVLVFSHLGMDGFLCCKVSVAAAAAVENAGDGAADATTTTITVTEPSTYIQYPVHGGAPSSLAARAGPPPGAANNDDPGHPLRHADLGFSTVGYGRMAVYNSSSSSSHGSGNSTTTRRRSLEAFVYSSYDGYVVIRDVLRDVAVTRTVPVGTVEVFDLAFSPDGKRLLLSHFEKGCSVLDHCDAERIEDVGEIEILRLATDLDDNSSNNNVARRRTGGGSGGGRSQYGYFSFSPDGKRAIALNMVPQRQFPHVIDLENGRLLVSRHWDDDASWGRFLFGVAAD